MQIVNIRLWVANQELVGANCDRTVSHLAAVGGIACPTVQTVAVRDLESWFAGTFLPLRRGVQAAGWDEDIEATPPSLVAFLDSDSNYTDAGTSLQQIFAAADENGARWAAQVRLAAKELAVPDPVEDQTRIRTHAELYRAAVALRDRLGVKGVIHCDCKVHDSFANRDPSVEFELWIFPRNHECLGVSENGSTDPQLVYNEFERLMRGCFALPDIVPATIEACDGTSILEKA